jgi:hypothetical protein
MCSPSAPVIAQEPTSTAALEETLPEGRNRLPSFNRFAARRQHHRILRVEGRHRGFIASVPCSRKHGVRVRDTGLGGRHIGIGRGFVTGGFLVGGRHAGGCRNDQTCNGENGD